MPPPPRVRPYKDFMTPLLHRRFARATTYLAFLCYAESLYVGGIHSWFWSWFPLGRAGIRAALIFIPAFMIFILRVSQLHVGLRTSLSGWDTFKTFPKFQVVQTTTWYLLSALLFSEIHLWSAPNSSDMGRVKYMPKTERPTLNEKPIYLTCYLLFLGVLQAGFHLYFDYDRIDTEVTKDRSLVSSTQNSHQGRHPADILYSRIPSLAFTSFKRSFILTILGPFVYSFPFPLFSVRSFSWGLTRAWARLFYRIPKSGVLPAVRPFHWTVLWTTFSAGFMLVLLWEVGNAAFSIYVGQPPLKNDRPITYESRDPNGSLLTGLQGKKVQTRAYAFWELVYIAQKYEGRRRTIYEDIDRPGGSMWSQILAAGLGEIAGINNRIADFSRPAVTAPEPSQLPPADDVRLPRLTQPLSSGLQAPGDLLASSGSRARGFETNVLTRNKTSNNALSPRAKAFINKAEAQVLSPEQQATKQNEGFIGLFRENIVSFLHLNFAAPFRQEYRRKIAAVALGRPHGDVGVIVDAIDSLTSLTICSLQEDKYGNVQRDVKTIIQAFTSAITVLEGFRSTIGVHWTDVRRKQESPETDLILYALKSGLTELVDAFGGYSEDLRLSQSELRMAREASSNGPKGQEMEQAGR